MFLYENLLDDLFNPHDKEIILKIKPIISSPDFYIWNHTHYVKYSVKSSDWFAEREAKKEAFLSMEAFFYLWMVSKIKYGLLILNQNSKKKLESMSGALPVAFFFANL